jgi:RNA polymerase sigma factor (sigma-70 family)
MMERSRLQAALAGDAAARVELGHWIARELLAFFRTFPENEIDDLVQDTAEDLIKKLDQAPDDPERFRRWMLGFAKIQARRFVPREQRERQRADELQRRVSPRTPTAVHMFTERLRSNQRRLLAWAIERLPDNLRDALEHHLAGRDHESLARARGVTMGTARWLVWRATQALRELVQSIRLTRSSVRSSTSS